MKKINFLFTILVGSLMALMVITFVSCDDEITQYGDSTLSTVDPFIQILTDKVAFIAGEADYTIEFVIVPGNSDATGIKIYNSYTDAISGETSTSVLLDERDFDEVPASDALELTYNFDQLRDGIVINGAPLTNNENEIEVGSKWVLTFEPINASGATSFTTDEVIEINVLSSYAGNYKVIESTYYRENTDQELPWVGETRFIGSLNDTTFSHPEWFGPFTYTDPASQFVFYLNSDDNSITIPASIDGESQPVSFGEYFVSCTDLGPSGDLSNVDCENSNILIPDFVEGKHVIKLSYGYYASQGTAVVSTRQFYEVLEKIVE